MAGKGWCNLVLQVGQSCIIANTDNTWNIPNNAESGSYTLAVTIYCPSTYCTSAPNGLTHSLQRLNAFTVGGGGGGCSSPAYPTGSWGLNWYTYTGDLQSPQGSCIGTGVLDSGIDPSQRDFDRDWGDGVVVSGKSDNVYLVMSQTVTLPVGSYVFTIGGDDGVRLTINGQIPAALNGWTPQAYTTYSYTTAYSSSTNLQLKLEWFEYIGGAHVSFKIVQGTGACGNPSYPSDRWERIYYVYSGDPSNPWGQCLGSGPDQSNLNFDDDWGDGVVAYDRSDGVGFVSSRTATFTAGTWTFTVGGDDGVRLYIDNQLVIDGWKNQAYTTYTKAMTFSSTASHPLRLEWYEYIGGAHVSFTSSSTAAQTCNQSNIGATYCSPPWPLRSDGGAAGERPLSTPGHWGPCPCADTFGGHLYAEAAAAVAQATDANTWSQHGVTFTPKSTDNYAIIVNFSYKGNGTSNWLSVSASTQQINADLELNIVVIDPSHSWFSSTFVAYSYDVPIGRQDFKGSLSAVMLMTLQAGTSYKVYGRATARVFVVAGGAQMAEVVLKADIYPELVIISELGNVPIPSAPSAFFLPMITASSTTLEMPSTGQPAFSAYLTTSAKMPPSSVAAPTTQDRTYLLLAAVVLGATAVAVMKFGRRKLIGGLQGAK